MPYKIHRRLLKGLRNNDKKSTFDSEESKAKKTKSERGEDEEAQQPL